MASSFGPRIRKEKEGYLKCGFILISGGFSSHLGGAPPGGGGPPHKICPPPPPQEMQKYKGKLLFCSAVHLVKGLDSVPNFEFNIL